MTLRLILTRHAKSSWDDPLKDDHSRDLNPRGIDAAAAIGDWLAVKKYLPDLVLCSTSQRTRQTWDLIAARLGATPDIQFEDTLYNASPDALLANLQRVGDAKSVLILAHNPGIANAASSLASQPPLHSQFSRYPSGATTIFNFDVKQWGDVNWAGGKVVDFVVPKDL